MDQQATGPGDCSTGKENFYLTGAVGIAQEINTFITLWKEETNETLEEVIEKSKLVLNVSI